MYVCMYVCIDILEHSTISMAITAHSSFSNADGLVIEPEQKQDSALYYRYIVQ